MFNNFVLLDRILRIIILEGIKQLEKCAPNSLIEAPMERQRVMSDTRVDKSAIETKLKSIVAQK